MELWEWSLEHVKITEMRGRILGAQFKINTFDFLFGCLLGKIILKQTDNLSKSLQSPTLSAAEGQEIAQDVIMTLEKDRNEKCFDLFWERLVQRRQQLSIPASRLPRKRQLPDFFGSTNNPSTQHHDTSKTDTVYTSLKHMIIQSKVSRIDSIKEISSGTPLSNSSF